MKDYKCLDVVTSPVDKFTYIKERIQYQRTHSVTYSYTIVISDTPTCVQWLSVQDMLEIE
jgi:hypothetical protein